MKHPVTAAQVVQFWRDAGPAKWFSKNDAFDRQFRETFHDAHLQAARVELDAWMETAEGALALLILLDQFPRNAFRGTAHMFATDPLARRYAREMLRDGLDRQVEPALRPFCYLPFEHSENVDDQRLAVKLCEGLDAETLRFAVLHADIVERFGRFPHRNVVLGRETTEEEARFLAEGGFAG